MKKSTKEAIKLLSESKIIFLKRTANNEYFSVQGSKRWYNVIYNKRKNIYTCDCSNIRLTLCKHIKAVMLFRDTEAPL